MESTVLSHFQFDLNVVPCHAIQSISYRNINISKWTKMWSCIWNSVSFICNKFVKFMNKNCLKQSWGSGRVFAPIEWLALKLQYMHSVHSCVCWFIKMPPPPTYQMLEPLLAWSARKLIVRDYRCKSWQIFAYYYLVSFGFEWTDSSPADGQARSDSKPRNDICRWRLRSGMMWSFLNFQRTSDIFLAVKISF